ncbi:Gfo/Idh/MocA family oxidoreductase [Kiritimatiella glycovorans]|uniref:4-carboxy-2-hydroxymuconate-6-semialdehyde dehydrogenase n=1 Tax=Kiritimatiella glycovorans TaxID=1307763 RepID=A0A0G3EG70_9BACT|nr:Gfo/Idh/MocA family oxidoreductase [Kiritimatiella glycovorans]AKJ64397.1 4-carboxy-2-hydroxymuconate-6-semialdehyde dehydrogenase [Kiritimatiella glycovorans]
MTNETTRREFMQKSGTAAAGLWLAASHAARVRAAETSSAGQINVGLVGVGEQGRVLLNAAKDLPGLNFTAVCDIWEYSQKYGRNYLRKFGHDPAVYTDYREMLEKQTDLDAVIVATPDFVHHEITIAALEAGKDVYCEKAMSNDIEKARAMVRAMKSTGRLLQIGHQRRSNPRYIHTYHNLLKKARITGTMTNANAQWNRAKVEPRGWPDKYTIPQDVLTKFGYADMQQFRNWRWYRKYGGGPIFDLGAHQIDIFNWFFGGAPRTVTADGGNDFYKDWEWYDNVMAIFEYDTPDGTARAFYQTLNTTSAGGGYWEMFMGTEGTVKIAENPKWTRVYREAHAPDWEKWFKLHYLEKMDMPGPQQAEAGKVDVRETAPLVAFKIPVTLSKPIHQPHLENFFAAMRGEEELNCPADHAFESEVAVFKVNPAIEAGRKMTITDEDLAV